MHAGQPIHPGAARRARTRRHREVTHTARAGRRGPRPTSGPVGSPPVWDYLQGVVLGIIQGLTEFLPISSSAHLRIFPELLGWEDPGAAFTAVCQIGTELAVLLYFRKDIWRIASSWLRSFVRPELRGHLDTRMGWFIIVGSLPIVLLGLLFEDAIDSALRSLWIVATMLVVLGIVLGVADRYGSTERTLKDLTAGHAVLMGLAQAAALVPGVSRSGATISMGRALGYEREVTARYAFLLAIPAVLGAGVYKLKDVPGSDNPYGWGPTITATVVSFFVGYAVIAWLLRYVSTRSFLPFVTYRVVLGFGVMGLLAAGVLSA
ncbi:undecaprenyl-diphosphate phosphatase [Nocardioides sp. ChNu-153]|nr:undecaprenyl-diphosphate phosphatase [Nocardioides sp. ChNu-153]